MTVHRSGSEIELRALDLFVKLRRASESVSAKLNAKLAARKLTEGQFGVLEALFHLGDLTQVDLSRKILRTGGNITMVVDNLERRGWVRRVRSEGDRRYVRVQLTEEGRRLIDDYFPSHARAVTELMAALTPAEQEALAALCRKLGLAAREKVPREVP
jgi:MarR family transcriptional regulator, 2-MHQ and catechol-resistance regulon repressor